MAKSTNTKPQSKILTVPQLKAGIARFETRIARLNDFDPATIQSRDDPQIIALETSIREAISETFGEDTAEFRRYNPAGYLDGAGYNFLHPTPLSEVIDSLTTNKARSLALMLSAIELLRERLAFETPVTQSPTTPRQPSTTDVFIVHGRDNAAKAEVSNFLRRLNLNPIVLNEQLNAGQTVIEKFEKHSDVGYAVVIVTPDDVGALAADFQSDPGVLTARARQNVILELGYFIAKIERKRICVLVKGRVDWPSDIAGVVFVEMDNAEGWQMRLGRELNAAGMAANLTSLFS